MAAARRRRGRDAHVAFKDGLREEASVFSFHRSLAVALVLCPCLVLQGCFGGGTAEEETPVHLVLEKSHLTRSPTSEAAIDYESISMDCTGQLLKDSLVRSNKAFRKAIKKKLDALEDDKADISGNISEDIRERHLSFVIPKDPVTYYVNGPDTGFLRKAQVYCHIRRYMNGMPEKGQIGSMVEEVQSRTLHIVQFLSEALHGFVDAKKSVKTLEEMKKFFGVQELSDQNFIRLREAVIPLQQEQTRVSLYAVSSFAAGGCLKQYFEDTLKDETCPWEKPKKANNSPTKTSLPEKAEERSPRKRTSLPNKAESSSTKKTSLVQSNDAAQTEQDTNDLSASSFVESVY